MSEDRKIENHNSNRYTNSDEIKIEYQCLHNPKNKLITYDVLKKIFQKADVLEDLLSAEEDINSYNLENFQRAFTHISYSENRAKKYIKNVVETEDSSVNPSKCVQIQKHSMEKLEWLGDAIIQSVVGIYIWERFPGQDEGFYTVFRSRLVKTEPLSNLAMYLGLGEYLLISKHHEDYLNGRNQQSYLEDCFEAFIGALYEQTSKKFKYDIVRKFIINVIETKIDIPLLVMYDNNYKALLMTYYQLHFDGQTPTYGDISMKEIVDENNEMKKSKIYTCSVRDIYGNDIAFGSATNKKDAQRLAAKEACKIFGLRVSDGINYYLKT